TSSAYRRCLLLLGYGYHLALHSFPTRRSSDLGHLPEDLLAALAAQVEGDGFLVAAEHLPPQPDAVALRAVAAHRVAARMLDLDQDRKSTRLNSSHVKISYAVFCLKKKT